MIGEQVLLSTVFVAGMLSFFSPCILPLLPVYVSVLSTDANGISQQSNRWTIGKLKLNSTLIFKTVLFVLGLSTSFVILGFGAGALGSIISSDRFITLCGAIVIVLGLQQLGLFRFSFLNKESKVQFKRSERRDLIGTYLLGFTFSFGWTPCIGPILGAVLGLSASEGTAVYGALLMFVYSLGLLIPFLILSIFSDVLVSRVKRINKYMGTIKIVGGILILIMGIFLMTNNLNWFTTLIPQ